MSLKQFLAVNHGFTGIRGEKSPYGVKKHCVLPTFEGKPRFRIDSRPSLPVEQLELVRQEKTSKAAPSPPLQERVEIAGKAPAALPVRSEGAKKRSIWAWLSFGLLRDRGTSQPLVQAELRLDKVQVIRNDLRDADLEVVRRKRSQARKAPPSPSSWDTVEQQLPWTRLAARLFDSETTKSRLR